MSQHWAAQWIASHGAKLLRYAKKLLGDEQSAQEATQDTFLRLLKMKREEVEGKLPEWLYHVCRNRAIDLMRRRKPTVSIDESSHDELSVGGDSLERLEGNERVVKMQREINKLQKEHQELIRLKFQDGLSYQQISEITGLSTSNIGFILSTSMKKIREGLGDYLNEGGSSGKTR